MRHSIIKFIVGTLLGIAVALLLLFNALLLWVATGPRSLNVVSKYIEAALEPPDQNYSIKIEETWLIWDGWKHPIDISLRNVSVLNSEKQRFSKFPEISLGLDLLGLAEGHLLPTSLTINHPDLSLFQNDDHSISFGFRKEPIAPPVAQENAATPPVAEDITEVPLAAVLAPLISPDENSSLRKLSMVSVVNADVSVGNIHKGIFFKASDAQMVFKSNRRGISAVGSAKISYDNYQSLLSAQFVLPKGGSAIDGKIDFHQLMPGILADLFADNAVLSAMKFPLSGEGELSIDTDGTLQQIDFVADGGKGTIETDKLDGALPVTTLHVEGRLSNHANDIAIKKFNANLDGMLIDADGTVLRQDKDAAIHANLSVKNVPSTNVHLLWPPSLAPETRDWVTKNISDGTVSHSESHFNIELGDLAKPELPKEDIDSNITIDGTKVRYLPDHPQLTNVHGTIHIDGLSLNAAIDSAQYMKQTKMSGGKVAIDDLNMDNPYIKVSFDAETSAKDVVRFLDLPRLRHAKRLGLSEDTAEGIVKGHAAVGFSFFAKKDTKADDDITYSVKADLKGVTQPGFMKKFDIKNADGVITVDNKNLEFKGSGDVNGASVSQADVKYLFDMKDNAKDNNFDTLIEATATAPMEVLPRFGYPAFPFIKGTIGIKASVKEGDALESAQASIDLTNASMEIDLPAVRWSKPDKEAASIDIVEQKKNEVATITSLVAKGKNVDIHGSAELDKEMSNIRMAKFERLVCGGTDLDHVVYEKTDGGFKIDANGGNADISAWLDSGADGTFSFEQFPAMLANLDIKQLALGKERTLTNVRGNLTCDVRQCGSADISGTTIDNKPFNFRILHNPKGNRQLSIHVQSAGAFLKAIDVFDGMEGGDLTITGSYDDSVDHSILKGMADINEYTVKDAPVLAKLLSLASFTGIFDTLQGKGIAFSKLRAPFTLSKDVITIKEAKTHGDAMGMTMEGTITFPKRTLDLRGTVVPSYSINHVLGNVPLVGTMLTGGEGQGVFAARYTINGSGKEQDVSVNPLSILTPGFLRGLFDIFDKPEKKSDDAE